MSRQASRDATASADPGIPVMLRVGEVMAKFGISESTVYRWLNQRKLTPIQVGGLLFVTADDVRRLIAEGITRGALRQPKKSASHAFNSSMNKKK